MKNHYVNDASLSERAATAGLETNKVKPSVVPKTKKLRNYVVYAYAPVNVRVKASSKKSAARLALEALDNTNPLNISDDDKGGIWIDSMAGSRLYKKLSVDLSGADTDAEVANTEA